MLYTASKVYLCGPQILLHSSVNLYGPRHSRITITYLLINNVRGLVRLQREFENFVTFFMYQTIRCTNILDFCVRKIAFIIQTYSN